MRKLYTDCLPEFLSECKEFKEKTLHVENLFEFSNSETLRSRASKIYSCGSFLRFGENANNEITLDGSNFCRQRLCPMCQWRRSRRLYGQLTDVWDTLRGAGFEFVHIVLTVRNCSAANLSGCIDGLFRNFTRMVKDTAFASFKGFLRFLEVTYSPRGRDYHPHLHVLGVVRPSYFKSRYYVSHEKLTMLWRQYAKLDYDPMVHIGKADAKAINEVAKYCVKPFDFDGLSVWDELAVYETYDVALHGRRMIQTYGCIRSVLHELKIGDLEAEDSAEQIEQQPLYHDAVYNYVTRDYDFI